MFGRSELARVFVEVWKHVVYEYLREFNYMAEMASLNQFIINSHDSVNFAWSGFNDSLPKYIQETISRIKDMKINE